MLKRGDIILTHSNTIIGWLIQKVTSSYWNHSAWALGPDLVVESLGGSGVIISNSSKYNLRDKSKSVVLRIKEGEVDEKQLTNAILKAQLYTGKGYDWYLIARLAYLYLFNKDRKAKAGDWDSKWICSELIAKPLWLESGFLFRDDIPVENIVPEDIYVSDKLEFVEMK